MVGNTGFAFSSVMRIKLDSLTSEIEIVCVLLTGIGKLFL